MFHYTIGKETDKNYFQITAFCHFVQIFSYFVIELGGGNPFLKIGCSALTEEQKEEAAEAVAPTCTFLFQADVSKIVLENINPLI